MSVLHAFLVICLLSQYNLAFAAHKSASTTQITKVHVIFMNHLDVGYADGIDQDTGFVVQVLNRYMTEYFVRAINISRTLIQEGYTERFLYTTHPWLVSLYLDCPNITLIGGPLKCPSAAEQMDFRQAVYDGLIAWHAFPFNIQTDFINYYLFEAGLELSQRLDGMFYIKRTHPTMSQRDVPGITKAVLASLKKYGIKAISVGVNPGTAPPDVPSPFVWKFSPNDEDGILAFWIKGGYPLNPGPNPAQPGGLSRDKCIIADGLSEALCFAFRTDNTGPPVTIQEVLGYYEILRSEFPGAELVASTFDNFVQALDTVRLTLPVRTSEIGDTWIQGVASDPFKYSRYRAFVRAWENCEGSYHCNRLIDGRIQNMLRYLVKLPEHTWGSHGIIDFIAWTNEALAAARQTKPYQINEDSWREQRQFLDLALTALEDHPLVQSVQREYEDLVAAEPDLSEFSEASIDQDYYCPNGGIIRFGSDGSLIRLYDPYNKKEWASPTSRLGQILYDTYVEQDFIDMAKLYNYVSGVGYDKPNMTENAHPEKKRWDVTLLNLYKYIGLNFTTCVFWVKAITKDEQTITKYGAPKVFYVKYDMEYSGAPWLNVTFLMLGKTTTRLPESISFGFQPVSQGYKWTLDKMSQYIDPCDVVLNGSQYVHGIKSDVNLLNQDNKGIQFYSRDVPIVNLGTENHIDSPFPVPLQPFECSTLKNFSFNIFNNIWNTNYPMWYPFNQEDENFKAEFTISFIN